MDWPNERYVRLYMRDGLSWKRWRPETRACFCFLLRRVDRSGLLELHQGMDPSEALMLVLEVPEEWARIALDDWARTGAVDLTVTAVRIPNFVEAQECAATAAARTKKWREQRAASAGDVASQPETRRHQSRHIVTDGDEMRQPVRHGTVQHGTAQASLLTIDRDNTPPNPPTGGALSAPRTDREESRSQGAQTGGDRQAPEAAIASHGVQLASAEASQSTEGTTGGRKVAARGVRKRSRDMTDEENASLKRVIDHLNEVVKRFDAEARGFGVNKTNAPDILARLRDGSVVEELCEVLDARAWEADREDDLDKRAKLLGRLNPTTPFRRCNWNWGQGLVRQMRMSGGGKKNGQERKVKHDDLTGAPYFVDKWGHRVACDERGRLPGEEELADG